MDGKHTQKASALAGFSIGKLFCGSTMATWKKQERVAVQDEKAHLKTQRLPPILLPQTPPERARELIIQKHATPEADSSTKLSTSWILYLLPWDSSSSKCLSEVSYEPETHSSEGM